MYKGKVAPVLMHHLLFLGLFGLITSFGLMGERWAHLFLASLAVMLPVLLVVTAVQAWLNRFSFDDERRVLVKPGGRGIRYDQVRAVMVTDRGATLDVFVKQGWLHTTALIEAAGADRKEELLDGLRQRFPDRLSRRGSLRSFVPVLVLLLAVGVLFGGAQSYLYKRYPELRAPIRTLERPQDTRRKQRPALEYVEAFGFTPPAGLRYLGEEKGELYFEDRVRKLRLKVMPAQQRSVFRQQAALFRYAMGVRDYQGLLSLSYRSRHGVIPLFLRALDLSGLDDAAVYEVGPPVSGLIKQGRREKTEETHIVLFGNRPSDEIHFFFTGPRRVPEEMLRKFIGSVTLVEAGRIAGAPFLFSGEGG